MKIAIYGATGFLGLHLIEAILASTNWRVQAVGRNPQKIVKRFRDNSRLYISKGDVSSYEDVKRTLKDVDVAYYFVHMMGRKDIDFYSAELTAAKNFIRAANQSSLKKVVYMGGLGDNKNSSSRHLKSRHLTGEIMRSASDKVLELRASMIIGNGSVAFDIIKNVVHRLPVMILPTSSNTLTQPIALKDAIAYLIAAAELRISKSVAIDIGGPDILSYADVYRLYANHVNKKRLLLKLPYVPDYLSSIFLNLMTPSVHARIGKIMSESMNTDMVVQNNLASKYFPEIEPMSLTKAMELT